MKYSINKGFSLIELLLTLSIIAILSVTAFFIYSKASQNEKDNELISAINEVGFAMKDVSKTNNNIDMSISTYSSFSVLLSPNSQKQIENYGMIYSNQTGLYSNMFDANGKALV
jgi:prepilin-type N-terminal cleavage/methylation domain-containing protein